jgi:hypothetical protein
VQECALTQSRYEAATATYFFRPKAVENNTITREFFVIVVHQYFCFKQLKKEAQGHQQEDMGETDKIKEKGEGDEEIPKEGAESIAWLNRKFRMNLV